MQPLPACRHIFARLRTALRLWGWWVAVGLAAGPGWGQPVQLRVLVLDADSAAVSREVAPWPGGVYPDSAAMWLALGSWIERLHDAAYLEAGIDTTLQQGKHTTALVHLGPPYRWLALRAGAVPEAWLARAGYRARGYRQRPVAAAQWLELRNRLVQTAAEEGYPFVRVYLDSLAARQPGQLEAAIGVQPGPLVFFSKLTLSGDARLSPRYLQSYLGFQPGQPYDEAVVRRVRNGLRELPFVQLRGDPKVTFTGNQAELELDLGQRRASRFDFIIGVLPNSNQTGKLLLTGQLEGEVMNGFGRGERLAVRFDQPRALTQELGLAFAYPYLLGLPFGADLAFELYRRDTNFLNLEWRAGLSYLLGGGDYFQVFATNQATNLLGVDSGAVARRGQLPDTLDVRRTSFGASYTATRLDYRFNPRRGWTVWTRASAGVRRIRPNLQLVGFGFGEFYDSLALRSTQYRLEMEMAGYLPVGQRGALKGGLRGGGIIADAPVLANEQFRIGGAKLLRGFDEQSIFARNYLVATLEYRFLLSQNSYLYAFVDQARTDARSRLSLAEQLTVDFPRGFGAGLTFETRAGLFGLSVALGRTRALPVDFGAPKVHLGYLSVF